MLDRFILGTANFTQSYGILSQGKAIPSQEVSAILAYAQANGIHTLDTAFAYGGLESFASQIKPFKVISKWSIKENFEITCSKLKQTLSNINKEYFDALLIHDPQNFKYIDKCDLHAFCQKIKDDGICKKVGVSIYDESDWENFIQSVDLDIIQLPLNPLNQTLGNDRFIEELKNKGIEVHARSLFLQGILLQEELPEQLAALAPLWETFQNCLNQTQNRLASLIQWALSQTWVDKWVIGVSSLIDLQQIANAVETRDIAIPDFNALKKIKNLIADPRQWRKL